MCVSKTLSYQSRLIYNKTMNKHENNAKFQKLTFFDIDCLDSVFFVPFESWKENELKFD